MKGFEYYTPTRVVFGKGTEEKTGELCAQYGATKALVHYGSAYAKKSGLIDRVCDSLAKSGVETVLLGGVQPNPLLSLVNEGIKLCKEQGVDFVLAVGGGSVIDSAKAIAHGAADPENGDVWDYFEETREIKATLPIGTVLTISAAGSEMSSSIVITNDETGKKAGAGHNVYSRPCFAVMNPELTMSVSAYQTAAGCADIIMHTLERYFTPEEPTMTVTDEIAQGLLRSVMANAYILQRQPQNYDARAEIMWASSLSHNGVTGCGAGGGDWSCHQLAHELSGKYDMTHGAALTSVWGSWARYVYKQNPARFAKFAVKVMGIEEAESDEETALLGIEELEGFFWALEMPTSLEEAEIFPTDEEIEQLADSCSYGGEETIGGFKVLNKEDMRNIYTAAK